jgi:ornithine carbamoyltransferase
VKHKDFISIHDYTAEEVAEIFRLAADMKRNPGRYAESLKGKTLAMVFEKASTRTRVSFEVGMFQLGGHALFLSSRDLQLGRGETIDDTARVLSRYVDGIMARTFAHKTVTDLAQSASVPVINGLTDLLHPCQAMTDYFTASEHLGELRGKKIAYVGDGNNMAHSLMFGGPKVGMHVAIAAPRGYEPSAEVQAKAGADAEAAGTRLEVTSSIDDAVRGADIVETDVWASMGQEEEAQTRKRDFANWQVDAAMMAKANPGAIFMHCLPAHRGEEVSAEVADSPQSVIFDEAENRLHVQKAIMYVLMKDRQRESSIR